MVYPCKGCTEKDNCEKNKCKKLKAYKKFRSENIKKNRVWAKESVDVKYRNSILYNRQRNCSEIGQLNEYRNS